MRTTIYNINYSARRSLHRKIRIVIFSILILLILCSLVTSYLIFSVRISSSSMEPTIGKNDWVFVSPLITPRNPLYAQNDAIKRGDIIFMKPLQEQNFNFFFRGIDKFVGFFTLQQYYPISNSKYMTENKIIRRVVALPGDEIYIKDYVAHIKTQGAEHFLTEFELSSKEYDILTDKELIEKESNLAFFKNCDTITLGEDEYFVLCDNRTSTFDSRAWGTVNARKISGKVLLKHFPPMDAKLF